MTEAAAAASAALRSKPLKYTGEDGNIIVEDEFLNFLVIKMKTMGQDELILLTTSHFSSERIASSRKVLFELCPETTQRYIQHRGDQKDVNNVKSCIGLLNELGDKVPRFVSYHLDELPPVSFNSIDVSCLLAKIEKLSADVAIMKQGMTMQVKVSDELRSMTVDLNQRLCVAEPALVRGIKAVSSQSHKEANLGKDNGRGAGAQPKSPAQRRRQTSWNTLAREECSQPGLGAVKANGSMEGGGAAAVALSPAWNIVAKRGLQAAGGGVPALRPKTRQEPRRDKKIVVGTGPGCHIRTVKTKLVSVFATKFSPELDVNILTAYLKDKLCHDVTCVKIDTAQSRYSSFKVTAECNEVNDMYDPGLWPDGALVRRFYEARKPRSTTGVKAGAVIM
jgi:hypothetical protein